MALDTVIKNGLTVIEMNEEVALRVSGSLGELFSVTDSFDGVIHSVSDISGVPIFKVEDTGVSTFSGQVKANIFDTTKDTDLIIRRNGVDYITVQSTGVFLDGNFYPEGDQVQNFGDATHRFNQIHGMYIYGYNDPADGNGVGNRDYNDARYALSSGLSGYLPLTGGTLSNSLNISRAPVTALSNNVGFLNLKPTTSQNNGFTGIKYGTSLGEQYAIYAGSWRRDAAANSSFAIKKYNNGTTTDIADFDEAGSSIQSDLDLTGGLNAGGNISIDKVALNTDTVFQYTNDGIARTLLRGGGSQVWYLRDSSNNEIGWITYSTPNGDPGIVFFNASGTGRSQIKQRAESGGISMGATSSSSNPADQWVLNNVGDISQTGKLTITDTTTSSGPGSGALIVAGGLGVTGASNFGSTVSGSDGTASNHFVTKSQLDTKGDVFLASSQTFTGNNIFTGKLTTSGQQITSANDPTSGQGLEILFPVGEQKGYVQAYDRDLSSWLPVILRGLSVELTSFGGDVTANGNKIATVAGSSGNIQYNNSGSSAGFGTVGTYEIDFGLPIRLEPTASHLSASGTGLISYGEFGRPEVIATTDAHVPTKIPFDGQSMNPFLDGTLAAQSIEWNRGGSGYLELSLTNITLTIQDIPDGAGGTILVKQSSTTARTLTIANNQTLTQVVIGSINAIQTDLSSYNTVTYKRFNTVLTLVYGHDY